MNDCLVPGMPLAHAWREGFQLPHDRVCAGGRNTAMISGGKHKP